MGAPPWAWGDCTVAGSWASCHRKSNVDRCTNFSWAAGWGMASVFASCAMCNLCQRSRAAAPLPFTARLHTPGCFNYGITYPLASGELSYLHMCVTHCAIPDTCGGSSCCRCSQCGKSSHPTICKAVLLACNQRCHALLCGITGESGILGSWVQ